MAIDPSGGATISWQNPSWNTWFTSYCAETFSSVTATEMQQNADVCILDFETTSGFPAATAALSSTGSVFTATNTLLPFTLNNAMESIGTAQGCSISLAYCTFDSLHNILGVTDATQGVFLVADRPANDIMVSGSQGMVAGRVYGTSPGGYGSTSGGVLLSFDRNISQFGVVLNAGSASSNYVICLFDSEGILIAKYSGGVGAGLPLYFGVKSANGLIRSAWIGQKGLTNGVVIDSVAFVPAPDPTTSLSYSFTGTTATSGWNVTNGTTLVTGTDGLTIQGTTVDSKIYRSISLPAGSYLLSGVGSGTVYIGLTTAWGASNLVSLNLDQSTDWRSDHIAFTAPGGSLHLFIQVCATPGTAMIQSLKITSMTPTPFSSNAATLASETATLRTARGMVSSMIINSALGSSYYAELKTWGCNIVRLQCFPNRYAESVGQDFWVAWPAFLSYLVQNIQQAQTAGLQVVIDLHEMPFSDDPPDNQTNWSRTDLGQRFGQVWKEIASAVVNNSLSSAVWAYELLNEPMDDAQTPNVPRQWWPLAANTLRTIRTIDSKTWIVYDVGIGSTFSGFNDLIPLPDTHIIYSAHFYYPTAFALQGVSSSTTGVIYSSSATDLSSWLEPADTFVAKWSVPVYIGEFSVVRWAPIPDSANWLSDLITLFEARQWSWSYFAWAEWNGWRLDMDNSYTPADPPTPSDDDHRTDRGQIIYNALQLNNQ